jgi:hypothetical protein
LGLETALTPIFFGVAFFLNSTFLAATFFFNEEALDEVFFLPDVLATLTFFLVPMDFEAEVFLLGFAIVFFFEAVFVFSGFFVDALRTDFFEAINNPFYWNKPVIVLSYSERRKNDNWSQVSRQESIDLEDLKVVGSMVKIAFNGAAASEGTKRTFVR